MNEFTKEMEEAMRMSKEACTKAMAAFEVSIQKKFEGAILDFSGSTAREHAIFLKIKAPQDRLAEVQAHCAELEENISYPQMMITVKPI